ncbi:endonuclease [Flavobacterium suncheonense GH29-5 = DSM 17707]|uniref:Endonuclease n=1 Tax=Flavobacterium suncheonense GH29-5 = DSM 17707 TaxID=1121899 RepID=A0A0A2MQM1_9FLAO|nr:endonuclease [Flavobacterium suncheonense GH29-5 = DSM 17707]
MKFISCVLKKSLIILLILCAHLCSSQIKLCTWNIANIGSSKSDENLEYIANTIKKFDVVAIQEVVPNDGGAQTIAKLADILNRKGAKWDYIVSNPTTGSKYKTERYAFLWKVAQLKKIGEAWLEAKYQLEIDREPYYCTFQYKGKNFTLSNFHAITKKLQPETEIKYFKFLPKQYSEHNLIFLGDFNCPQSHSVFGPLKGMGYKPVFQNQKTSLKKQCNGSDCLASEYDNIFINTSKVEVINTGVIHFYQDFESIQKTKEISDHIPIWATIEIK